MRSQFVLKLAYEWRRLSVKIVGIDTTTIEADAAMKSIVRHDAGEE